MVYRGHSRLIVFVIKLVWLCQCASYGLKLRFLGFRLVIFVGFLVFMQFAIYITNLSSILMNGDFKFRL